MYISPKLCLTPEIKSKYFRTGECVGIGQTTVSCQLNASYQTEPVDLALESKQTRNENTLYEEDIYIPLKMPRKQNLLLNF